LVRLVPA